VGTREPLQEFLSIQERMNRLFEETLSAARSEAGAAATWTPPVDVYETAEAIVVQVELPGLRREDIEIQVQDNVLTLQGERRLTRDVREESYLRIERATGPFHRRFTLPGTVTQERIRAEFRDGVLELTLPKAPAGAAHRIPIQTV
jgi:HSP20 family protein